MADQTKLEQFISVYRGKLIKAHTETPELYVWPIENLDVVVGRMTHAIEKKSYNKESPAFRQTCRELGIKYTYKAIDEFIKS